MARIFEKILTRMDKENGLKIRNAERVLLPSTDSLLDVEVGNTNNVLHFEYNVSGRAAPIIRGKEWRKFISRYHDGSTIILYKNDEGSAANYKIVVI
ncbi:hypothetical protein REPUB_Repub01dG0254400 [Reevesia pubescens]